MSGNPVEVQARGSDLMRVDLSLRLTGTNCLDGGRIPCVPLLAVLAYLKFSFKNI